MGRTFTCCLFYCHQNKTLRYFPTLPLFVLDLNCFTRLNLLTINRPLISWSQTLAKPLGSHSPTIRNCQINCYYFFLQNFFRKQTNTHQGPTSLPHPTPNSYHSRTQPKYHCNYFRHHRLALLSLKRQHTTPYHPASFHHRRNHPPNHFLTISQ